MFISQAEQTGFCHTWSETPKTGFLATRLILSEKRTTKALVRLRIHLICAFVVHTWYKAGFLMTRLISCQSKILFYYVGISVVYIISYCICIWQMNNFI